jgi:hypothetical protein
VMMSALIQDKAVSWPRAAADSRSRFPSLGEVGVRCWAGSKGEEMQKSLAPPQRLVLRLLIRSQCMVQIGRCADQH